MGWRTLLAAAATLAVVVGGIRTGESSAPTGKPSRSAAPRAAAPAAALRFVENAGQWRDGVRFAAQGARRTLLLGDASMTVVARDGARRAAVEFAFDGARAAAPRGESPTRAPFHWFRSEGTFHARTFRGIAYDAIWPGVDLRFDAAGGAAEYTLVVHPGADAAAARFAVRGATNVETTPSGELAVATPAGTIVQSRPVAWQEKDGARVPVDVAFDVSSAGGAFAYSFALGAHDASRAVVIDPTLTIETLAFGGTGFDAVNDLAYDALGNLYAAGISQSADAIPEGTPSFDAQYDAFSNAFVAKYDAAGELAFASYLGTSSSAGGIGVDASGRFTVTGSANVAGFPVLNGPLLTYQMPATGFITRFEADGASLSYSGFLDYTGRLAVASDGTAFVAGTVGGGPRFSGKVVKVGTDAQIAWTLILNTSPVNSIQRAFDVAVDGNGSAYVVGYGPEGSLPPATVSTIGAGTGVFGAYVAKINATGTGLDYAAWFGGSPGSVFWAVDVDEAGAAYAVGQAQGAWAPLTVGPVLTRPDLPVEASVVAKIAPDGSHVEYSGYLGPYRFASAIAVDSEGGAFVAAGADLLRVTADGSEVETVAKQVSAGAVAVDASGDVAVAATGAGNDSTLEVITGFVPAVPRPDPVTAVALSTTSVRVTWTPHGQYTGFVVERARPGGAFEVITETGGGTSIDDLGLDPGATYRYRVRERRIDVLSKPSAEAVVRTDSLLDFTVRRGRVLDLYRPARDSVRFSGRIDFNAAYGRPAFDPAADAVHIAVGGDPSYALDVAAGDPRWTVLKGGARRFRGTMADGSSVTLVVDLLHRRVKLVASQVTLASLPGNPVETTLQLGEDSAVDARAWRTSRRARLSFP